MSVYSSKPLSLSWLARPQFQMRSLSFVSLKPETSVSAMTGQRLPSLTGSTVPTCSTKGFGAERIVK